ncbi:HEAT repeat domain-containing protein [Natrononativus amylolyticus]|uniref:HEAT repeat domain-containing protein n=1 Tax=Natrononativus amylolyticus TaxID=2963434 RepID=UPI0020CCE38A|nr:HEAT repeat domain-containing protein [Natrononativus amylolyticus]
MSDEDAPETAEAEESGADEPEEITVDGLNERLEGIGTNLEGAETEADLDAIEAELETLRADFEGAEFPEPDDDDEDPAGEFESGLEDLETTLEDSRGPYAADVVAEIDDAIEEIAETRWTEQGEAELLETVETFVADVNEILGTGLSLSVGEDVPTRLTATLEDVAAEIEAVDLDPDADAETIAELLEAADALTTGVEDAQTWDDLSVREQLRAQGYYDVLEHVKDYPPEWHALKVHEKQGNVEMVLLALETFDSDFMEEHALEALTRMGPVEATEAMLGRAGKRDKDAIAILGKIGEPNEEAIETLLDYVDADKDPLLQQATFKALGEMGATDAVQPIANKLVAENDDVRSAAAGALGLIGDTRAIEPLADVLADDEEDTVRASAARALNQIGTEQALEAVAEYADDRAYLVQAEAEKADLEPAT